MLKKGNQARASLNLSADLGHNIYCISCTVEKKKQNLYCWAFSWFHLWRRTRSRTLENTAQRWTNMADSNTWLNLLVSTGWKRNTLRSSGLCVLEICLSQQVSLTATTAWPSSYATLFPLPSKVLESWMKCSWEKAEIPQVTIYIYTEL